MYILISSITFLSFILISIRHLYYSPYIYYINSSLYYYILPQRCTTFKPLHHLISYIDSMKNPYHHVIYHIDVHPSGTTTSSIIHCPFIIQSFILYYLTIIPTISSYRHSSSSLFIFIHHLRNYVSPSHRQSIILPSFITSIIYPNHHIIHYIDTSISYCHIIHRPFIIHSSSIQLFIASFIHTTIHPYYHYIIHPYYHRNIIQHITILNHHIHHPLIIYLSLHRRKSNLFVDALIETKHIAEQLCLD